jgi:hypothetical protein
MQGDDKEALTATIGEKLEAPSALFDERKRR